MYRSDGLISQMPLTTISPPVNVLDNRTYFQGRVGNDTASVGYYSAELLNGVKVELSASRHSGIFQYTFPAGEKHVLVDLSHYLPSENGGYTSQTYLGGRLEVVQGADNTSYQGHADYGAGWNEGAPYRVFFCGEFDSSPNDTQFFRGQNTEPTVRQHSFDGGSPPQAFFQAASSSSGAVVDSETVTAETARGARVGAVFSWQDDAAAVIRSRVGISFMSTEDACQQYQEEIPSYNLTATVEAAVKEWNSDVFSTIQVATDDSANTTYLRLLYSSLYFMHIMPSERTGQNPLWQSDEPYWDDFCEYIVILFLHAIWYSSDGEKAQRQFLRVFRIARHLLVVGSGHLRLLTPGHAQTHYGTFSAAQSASTT